MRGKQILGITLAMMLAFGLTACGSQQEEPEQAASAAEETPEPTEEPAPTETPAPTPTETPTPTPEPEPELKAIGSPDGQEVISFTAKNASGKAIEKIAVKLDTEEEYPEDLAQDEPFADGEERIVYFDIAAALEVYEEEQEEAAEDAPLITPGYTVRLTYEDEAEHELHAFPVEDTDYVEIYAEEDYSYIVYESKLTGETVSTEEAEKEIAAEQAAAESEAVYTEGTVDQSSQTNTTETAPADTATTDPNAGCLDDGLTYDDSTTDPNAGCLDDGMTYTGDTNVDPAPAAADPAPAAADPAPAAVDTAPAAADTGCLDGDGLTY